MDPRNTNAEHLNTLEHALKTDNITTLDKRLLNKAIQALSNSTLDIADMIKLKTCSVIFETLNELEQIKNGPSSYLYNKAIFNILSVLSYLEELRSTCAQINTRPQANFSGGNYNKGQFYRKRKSDGYVGNNLSGSKFSNADLTEAKMQCCDLHDSNFTNIKGKQLSFNGANISNCDFTNANLIGAFFTNVYDESYDMASMSETSISSSLAVATNASGANFTNADLTGAHFSDVDVRSANFTNANLTGTDFTGAKLTNANLSDANL